MTEATCRTCPFASPSMQQDERGEPAKALCHHASAAGEAEPTRHWHWWCSAHPLRQRDRLAAMAMQGILGGWDEPLVGAKAVAIRAYEIADAMLAERDAR